MPSEPGQYRLRAHDEAHRPDDSCSAEEHSRDRSDAAGGKIDDLRGPTRRPELTHLKKTGERNEPGDQAPAERVLSGER